MLSSYINHYDESLFFLKTVLAWFYNPEYEIGENDYYFYY